MFGADGPIVENLEEAGGAHVGGHVQIFRKRTHGTFVDFEKEAVLAAEVLEDRAFGDAQGGRHIAHARRVIAILRKISHGGVDNAGTFGLRPRPGGVAAYVVRRLKSVACNSTHVMTPSHGSIAESVLIFN